MKGQSRQDHLATVSNRFSELRNVDKLKGKLEKNHLLARYTSWRIGGPADHFYRPADLSDLQYFLKKLPQDEPLTWLGLGSNVLVRDKGVRGTVVLTLNRLKNITLLDGNMIRAEAGVTCAKLSKFCVEQGFEDGAFFAGIPGTVGGALAMNAGAFGGETWRQVKNVEVLNRAGRIQIKDHHDFSVQYRQVDGLNGDYFIAGTFQFTKGDSKKARSSIKTLLKKRGDLQPIGQHSCGSVFRNPEGDHAARLIERAGLKGLREGGAQVSRRKADALCQEELVECDAFQQCEMLGADARLCQHRFGTRTASIQVVGQRRSHRLSA